MKNKVKKFLVSFTCVLLACVMLFMTACSSVPKDTGNNNEIGNNSGTGSNNTNNDAENNDGTDGDDTDIIAPPNPDDTIFEDYELNTTENFVYSLVYSDLTKQYDTFTGYVTLQSSARSSELIEVYGISYVDYQEGYIDETGKTYFSAGFISFPDESIIAQSTISAGLEIVSLEEVYDDEFSYVYSYSTEDVHMHCVIDNKYVKYDIVDGALQYTEEPYVEGMPVDATRGNIYNYDIEEYVYIVEEQDYVPVAGVSLLGEADYQDIMDEVNRILKTQEANLTYAEIESYVSQSQDALYSYLLGLQEETFMGIPTAELVNIVKDLDPMQHLQIGVDENGATTIDIIEVTKLPTMWEKIATSIICAMAVVGGTVCSVFGGPVGAVFGGAIVGAAMETFSQVVISNTPVSDIQWTQVAVATVAGAIAGGVSNAISGVAVQGAGQLFMREAVDTLCDGIIGGGEFFVNSLIAGCSFEEACQNFGYGVIAGVVIGGTFKVASAGIKAGAKLIRKSTVSTISDVGGKQVTKLGNEAAEDSISELQKKAVQKATRQNASDILNKGKKYIDDNGILYRKGKNLQPNTTSTINGYTFTTDELGRTSVSGKLQLKPQGAKRLNIADSIDTIGHGDQLYTDVRGHLIADRFNGPNNMINIVAQDGTLNRKEYWDLEEFWAKALKDNKDVYVDIRPIYLDNLYRPIGFDINYTIDDISSHVTFLNGG